MTHRRAVSYRAAVPSLNATNQILKTRRFPKLDSMVDAIRNQE